jgi:hypothetical protein
MLKRYFLYVSALTSALISANILQATDVFVEAKAAYYRPTDDKFREIYSDSGIYGGEISCQAWRGLYGWASASCFHKGGHSIRMHDSTTITFVPLGFGLKYLFPVSFVDLYVGAGMLNTYAHIEDDSHFVIHSHSKWGQGGIVKAGAIFNVNKHFFVDLFSDYSFMKIDFHNTDHEKVVRHDADLSGWSIGAGVGYRFGYNAQRNKKDAKK